MSRPGSRRRRNTNDEAVVIYWRDIPAQVCVGQRPNEQKLMLHHRFQNAIDRAAAVAGLTDAASYVAQWRRVSEPVVPGTDLADAAAARLSQLESDHPPSTLQALVRSGGWHPSSSQTTDPGEGQD